VKLMKAVLGSLALDASAREEIASATTFFIPRLLR
jgi:hypothetical protein